MTQHRLALFRGRLVFAIRFIGVTPPLHCCKIHGWDRNHLRPFRREIKFPVLFLIIKCHRLRPPASFYFLICLQYSRTTFFCKESSVQNTKGSPAASAEEPKMPKRAFPLSGMGTLFESLTFSLRTGAKGQDHSMILPTTPEPTVRPPSRIAKRRPSSIATGVSSSTCIMTLSPGMHISVPSGRVMMPVTSVVRK